MDSFTFRGVFLQLRLGDRAPLASPHTAGLCRETQGFKGAAGGYCPATQEDAARAGVAAGPHGNWLEAHRTLKVKLEKARTIYHGCAGRREREVV